MQCDLLLPAFMAVAATVLLLRPCRTMATSWASLLAEASCALAKYTPLALSFCTCQRHNISCLDIELLKQQDMMLQLLAQF